MGEGLKDEAESPGWGWVSGVGQGLRERAGSRGGGTVSRMGQGLLSRWGHGAGRGLPAHHLLGFPQPAPGPRRKGVYRP